MKVLSAVDVPTLLRKRQNIRKYPNWLKMFIKHLNAPDTILGAGEAKICKTVLSVVAQFSGKHRRVSTFMKTHFDNHCNRRTNRNPEKIDIHSGFRVKKGLINSGVEEGFKENGAFRWSVGESIGIFQNFLKLKRRGSYL